MARSSTATPKAKKGRQQAASAARSSVSAQKSEDVTLVQAEQAASKAKAHKSQAAKASKDFDRKIETALNKAIRDDFMNLSSAELDGRRHQGRTLRETLREDKRACRSKIPDAPTMGKI